MVNFLRKPWMFLSLCSFSLLVFCFNSSNVEENKDEKEIFRRVKETLLGMSFEQKNLDNKYSEDVFNKYFESIDPYKRFFLESDMKSFEKNKSKMGIMFVDSDVSFFYTTIGVLKERILNSEKYIDDIFSEGINLNEKDSLLTDEKKIVNPKNKIEAKKNWERYVKYSVLNEIFAQKNKNDTINLDIDKSTDVEGKDNKEADNPDKKVEKRTEQQIEKESIEKVKGDLKDFFRRIKLRKDNDYFTSFINSFTEVFDNHTTYFSPREKDDFNAGMSGKIIGIGATLQDEKGYPTIKDLVIGGPAWKSKKIESGDKILKVQEEGKNSKDVSLVGMLLDDAIRYIRGKEGSSIILTLEKKNGNIISVNLIREEIEIQETFARSSVITDTKTDKKYGIIYLPEFYIDLEGKGSRICSEDVKKEIEELKKQNIEGLIFDLRGNGGGSLSEVVDIVQFFIGKGPVVQVKDSDGKVTVLQTRNSDVVWDGPMTVLTNETSASASEIFAGAMQDYKRALIIGSKQTYGKGTVQTVYPLSSRFSMKDIYGALKVTIQKFYRVNGLSTQLKGVNSDIVIPSIISYDDILEKAQKFALPWDKISPADYKEWGTFPDSIKQKSLDRLAKSSYISSINDIKKWVDKINNEKKVSLNKGEYIKYMEYKNQKRKSFEKEIEFTSNLKFGATIGELEKFKTDKTLKEKRDIWYKAMKKDFEIFEAINVINDLREASVEKEK